MAKEKSTRKAGRPRSQAAQQAVLDAANKIMLTEGLGRLSIERVAAEAGVGKPTIYRNWANAHELAMAALMQEPVDPFRSPGGSAKQRLQAHLKSVLKTFSTSRGRQITLTLASAEQESELAKAFRNQVILQSRAFGHKLIEQAIAEGAVNPAVDIEAALDALYGPIFFRLLVGHLQVDESLAGTLVDMLFSGIEPSGKHSDSPPPTEQ